MYSDLDELVLSGKLFNNASRSSSPARSASPSSEKQWPTSTNYSDDDSDKERSRAIEKALQSSASAEPRGIGMRPGRTGVKGVIRDRAEARELERDRQSKRVDDLNQRMEKANLGGKTFLEEEREAQWERAMLEGAASALDDGASSLLGGTKPKGTFGHLREVGVSGFVNAVEKEAGGTSVVVHLYDPSLERCYQLDSVLARLARLHPRVKFLRTRAVALGFATLPQERKTTGFRRMDKAIPEDDEDDPYAEVDVTEDIDDEESDEEGEVDLDVLPTMLVYRDGDLVHNWVRVDWEAGKEGVEDLLHRHNVLKTSNGLAYGNGNCGLPSDDEDLQISDDDVLS